MIKGKLLVKMTDSTSIVQLEKSVVF